MSRVITDSEHRITCAYGNGHGGVDLGWRTNEKENIVHAHTDGVVVQVVKNYKKTDKTGNSYGNYVKIRHRDGYYTLYAHMKYGSVCVSKGDNVRKDEKIGIEGSTGRCNGRHLHFEVRNKNNIRIDPTKYLTCDLPGETSWTKGTYQLLKSKAIRTDHKITNNIVKVWECREDVRPLLTSNKPNEDAYYKKRIIVTITDIYVDNTSRVWGKLENCWIVLCNKDGSKQAEKVG